MIEDSRSSFNVGLAVAIVLAGGIVALAVYFAQENRQPIASESGVMLSEVAGTQDEPIVVTIEEDDPVLGVADAPVTIVEFSDFECPYCRQFHQTTFRQLRETYIDSGKARFVHKDFPLSQIHPQAQAAAAAAYCAGRQGQFWEYAEKLYAPEAVLDKAALEQYAQALTLDTTAFTTCQEESGTEEKITRNARAAIAAGVTGTPAFVVNGVLIEGALPLAQFTATIEAALRQAQE
ncbi:MAG: DsbA family protein [Candidatus Andersenbacteria bacterium]